VFINAFFCVSVIHVWLYVLGEQDTSLSPWWTRCESACFTCYLPIRNNADFEPQYSFCRFLSINV